MDHFEAFARRALKALNESGIDYVVVGGLVAIKYGRPRSTMDIDVIVQVDPNRMDCIEALIYAFTQHHLEINTEDPAKSLLEEEHVPIFDSHSPYRIDLKNARDRLDFASLKNRRKAEIFGVEAWIESLEDLIIAKLVYGGQQDEYDVLAVIIAQKGHLRLNYIRDRAKEERVDEKVLTLFKELKLPAPWNSS